MTNREMQCVRLYGADDLRLETAAVPEIGDDEVLLKTSAVAICGSDIRMWKNGHQGVDAEHPLTLGHEFAGVIAQAGKNAAGFHPGMKVSLQPNIGCGVCDRCVAGNFHLCETYQAFGINMDGAMAEYVRIPAPALVRGNLAALPDGLSMEEAALAEPMSCTYNGFLKMSAKVGEYAMVVGAGPIGISHAQLLHLAGCHVILCDLSGERLAECREFMPYIIPVASPDMASRAMEITGGKGLDIAVVACPVPAVQAEVLELMNYGGRVNYFGGIPRQKQPVAINTNLIHYRELHVTGSTRSSISQYRETLRMLAGGQLNAKSIITHRYPISQALRAFENASKSLGLKHVIVFN